MLAQKRLRDSSDDEEKQILEQSSEGFDGFQQSQSEISIPGPDVEIQSMEFGDGGKKSHSKQPTESDNCFVTKIPPGATESYVSETGVVQKRELQNLKYINEGGMEIKKYLFNMNLQVYKKEVSLFQQQNELQKGRSYQAPPGQPGEDILPVSVCNVRFDKKVDELVYSKM